MAIANEAFGLSLTQSAVELNADAITCSILPILIFNLLNIKKAVIY